MRGYPLQMRAVVRAGAALHQAGLRCLQGGGVGRRGLWLVFMGWGQEGQPRAGLAPKVRAVPAPVQFGSAQS